MIGSKANLSTLLKNLKNTFRGILDVERKKKEREHVPRHTLTCTQYTYSRSLKSQGAYTLHTVVISFQRPRKSTESLKMWLHFKGETDFF